MRSKDTLVLEKLYSKIITEKFYSYDPPQDKKTLMYDFYVINYLQFLLTLPSQGFRDLPDDIVDSVKTAAQKLYPYLKKELLDAVFFSICAEWRHFSDYSENYQRIENMYKDNENIMKFFNMYDRYRKFYKKGSKEQEELTKIFGVEKPSAQNRPPEIEKKEGLAERVTSYKAVNYALEQTGMSRSFFVSLARDCYIKLIWSSSYGGDAWCGICKGWLLLDAAEKMEASAPVAAKTPEAEVKGKGEEAEYYKQKAERTKKKEAPAETKQLDIPAAIDHIYDLQHNTDTVFNKLRSYYKGGYGWIEQALTDKANVKSYFELLKKTSGTVRALAPRILYNKLGQTWESTTKNKTPDSNSGIPKIKSKETKCGDIPRYQEVRPSSQPDQDNFQMTPAKKDNPDSSSKPSGDYSSSKFSLPELNAFIEMPEDSVWKIGNNYGLTKETLVAGKDQPFGGVDMGTSIKLYELNVYGEPFEKIGKPFKIPTTLKDLANQEKLTLTKYVTDTIYNHKYNSFYLTQHIKPKKISETDVKQVLEVLTKGGIYGLGNGFYMKATEGALPQITKIELWGPNGFVTSASEPNAKSKVKELTKKLNDDIRSETDTQSNQGSSSGVYITADDLMYALDVMGANTPYALKDGYTIAWEEYPNDAAYTNIYVVNPQGQTIHKIKEKDPKSETNELSKLINNYIKVDVAKGTLTKKGLMSPPSSSSASGILNQGVYVTGSDIDALLQGFSANEVMELKDGFYVSYWKSTAVPSQKGFLQFRVWKKTEDDDYKLIHNMTDQKTGSGAVASEINNAIKEYIKENPTSKSYDPTKSPGYVPSVGFSPTLAQQPEEEEEPEYSIDEEEDIEDGYINVKAIKFVFYSGKLDLGDGYTAIVGPKINGPTPTPDPFKILEVKKGKKVIFTDRLYESDVEDKFQKVKSMAETINKKIKEEEGDIDSEHSMSGMTSDPSPKMQMMDLDYIIKMPMDSPYNFENGIMAWKKIDSQKGHTKLVITKKVGSKYNIIMSEPFDFPNADKWEPSFKENLIKYINNIIKDSLNESFKSFFFRTV